MVIIRGFGLGENNWSLLLGFAVAGVVLFVFDVVGVVVVLRVEEVIGVEYDFVKVLILV